LLEADAPPLRFEPDDPPLRLEPDEPPLRLEPEDPPLRLEPDDPPLGLEPDELLAVGRELLLLRVLLPPRELPLARDEPLGLRFEREDDPLELPLARRDEPLELPFEREDDPLELSLAPEDPPLDFEREDEPLDREPVDREPLDREPRDRDPPESPSPLWSSPPRVADSSSSTWRCTSGTSIWTSGSRIVCSATCFPLEPFRAVARDAVFARVVLFRFEPPDFFAGLRPLLAPDPVAMSLLRILVRLRVPKERGR
jgi:hypothetical protein